MVNRRWTENELLTTFNNFSVPITDMNEGVGGTDKQAGVPQFRKIVEYCLMDSDTNEEIDDFNNPLYLQAGIHHFATITGANNAPNGVMEDNCVMATLEVFGGKDPTSPQGFTNYVMQRLTYMNLTKRHITTEFRGVILSESGDYQSDTGWNSFVDTANIALSLAKGATVNGSIVASIDDFVKKSFALENTPLEAGDNIDTLELGTYGTHDFSIYSQILGNKPFENPFKLFCFKGGVNEPNSKQQIAIEWTSEDIAIRHTQNGSVWTEWSKLSEYAKKTDIPAGLSEQSILDITRPINSGYNSIANESPMQLFNSDKMKSWWNETQKGSKTYIRVRQEDFRVPQIDTLGSGRNLITVLNASSVQDAFAKLKQRVISRDYSGLMLGDYLDIPSINTGSRSGAGTIQNNSSWNNLRVEIAASDFYDYGGDFSNHGILFVFKNVVYKHRMNPSNSNTGGYLASELYPIINEDFTTGLTEAIGFEPKEIHRSLDNGYGSSTVNWSTEKVFIPTEMEMFGTWTYGMTTKPKHINLQNIQQFPIYQKRGGNSGRIKNFEGSSWYYWESSSYNGSSTRFAYVCGDGSADYNYASYTGSGVSPAFYIG